MIPVDAARVLRHEVRVTWADNQHPELHRYLRETVEIIPRRRSRPGRGRHAGRLVAWAELDPATPAVSPGRFLRRVWWLAEHDPYDAGHPVEAVDPCSIRPGHESRSPRWSA